MKTLQEYSDEALAKAAAAAGNQLTSGAIEAGKRFMEEPMTRMFGIQPGGGILNVYQFDPEEFGAIGATRIAKLKDDRLIQKERKPIFNAIRDIIEAYGLTKRDEEIQYVAVGTNKQGRDLLIVVTIVRGGPE